MASLSKASSMSRSSSLCLDSIALPAATPAARPALPRPAACRKSRLRVRAEQQQPKGLVSGIRSSCTKFLNRYDPVTTGVGSLLVTGYCVVAYQQSVWEALNCWVAATVLGLVSAGACCIACCSGMLHARLLGQFACCCQILCLKLQQLRCR